MSQGASRAVDRLEPFVNPIVGDRLRRDPSPLQGPESFQSAGAVLLADVSGFTSLTETCARKGPAGAEEVRELLNAHFGPLVDLVTGHGGQVLHFAGDAAIAWFPATELAAAAGRAAACAARIVERRATADGLPVRVGVGVGPMTGAFVGGTAGRWEAVLAGEALNSAVAALRQAPAGQVSLSPQAQALAGSAASAGAGAPARTSLSSEAEPALRSFIPPSLVARLDAGQTDWLGEFRQVSVLFVGVQGVDFEARDRAHALTQALQAAVFEHDGTIVQLVVDDKATTLVAVWGLALQTHEDDAVRAVRAAARIHADVARLGWTCGIGIAGGRAFVGLRGTDVRRDYAVIGDVVNLAARVMEAAGNRVLTDTPTRAAARRRVLFEALPPVSLKGKTAAVPVFRPLREKRRLARDQRDLIGRARERDVLTDALLRVSTARANELVLVEGEPGIGKSRLIAALLERVTTSPLRGIVASGDALERSAPLHAWRGVVAGLLGYDEGHAAPARHRLLAMLEGQPALEPFASLANNLLPLGLPDTPSTASLTAEGRAERTRELLVHLLRAIAPDGAVLVLEDVHWFDSASWGVAEALFARVERVLIVAVSRPTIASDLPEEARRLLAHASAQTLKLTPLDTDDIVALACQRIDVDSVPEAVAQLIRDRSEGHPLFAGELAVTLRDRGLVRVEDGDCVLAVEPAALASQGLPTTVEGIVTGRLDLLPAPHQITAKLASVFGRSFSTDALSEVHPIEADKPHLGDQIQEMVRLDLLEPDPDGAVNAYRFTHAIIQQVAYGLLPFAQRRQLHRAVAEWYERRHAGTLDVIVPLLAHHWRHAEDVPKALEYLERAGQQALERDNNQEAVRFFTDVLALSAAGPEPAPRLRQAHWHTQLGDAYFHLARFPAATEQIERGLAMLGVAIPHSPGGQAWVLGREAARQAWHLARGPRPHGADVERARIATAGAGLLAWIHMTQRNSAGLMLTSLVAVNQAERAGAASVFARGMLGVMATAMGARGLGRRYFERARDEGLRTNAVRELSVAALFDAMDLLGAGDQAGSLQVLDDALRQARGGRSSVCRARILSVIGLVHGFAGRMQEASRLGRESVALLPDGPLHDRFHILITAISLDVMTLSGTDGLARLAAEEGRLRALLEPDDGVAAWSLGSLRTMALMRAGRLREALKEADALYGLWRAGFRTTLTIQWLLFWSLGNTFAAAWEAARGTSDAPAMEKRLRGFARLLQRFARKNPVYAPRALIVAGQIHMLSGHADRAREAWRRAADEARAFGSGADEAVARHELGRSMTAGDERREMLSRSHELFARGGMQHEAHEVQHLLLRP